MKTILLSTSIILLVTVVSQAQFLPDVRLTTDPKVSVTSQNNAWCIAASGNFLHVVWYDNRHGPVGNTEIYYRRSTDGGLSWEEKHLTDNPSGSYYPSVAVSGEVVHVVWQEGRDGNWEIYYKRSTDGGTSWEPDTRLTNSAPHPLTSASERPSVSVSGKVVHVVWNDYRDSDPALYYFPNAEIYYKRSIDGGESWETDTRLTNDTTFSATPSVSVSGTDVHVLWTDYLYGPDPLAGGTPRIYYKRSTDAGISWEPDTLLINNYSFSPSVSAIESTVHVVWSDARDGGNAEIYYKRSTDRGLSWQPDIRLTNNPGNSFQPSIVSGRSTVFVSGRYVPVVWMDDRDGNWEIYYKRSKDNGTSWGPDKRLTHAPRDSRFASVSISGEVVHVVWHDSRNSPVGNTEIYYKRTRSVTLLD